MYRECALGEPRSKSPERRVAILEAAIEVFAERGYHAARVSDIAKVAQVADGTIYLYFRNKEELLLKIFEEKMELLLQGVTAALEGVDDPLDRVRAFARFHFDAVERYPALSEVLQVELRLSNKFIKEYRPQQLYDYLRVFESILKDGQARGVVRKDVDTFLSMWAFFGALDEIGMQSVLSRRKGLFHLPTAAEQVANIFIRGLSTAPPGAGSP